MGGKSRKSGGVSRKLIDRIKQGNYKTPETTKQTKKRESHAPNQGGFDLVPEESKRT